MHGLSCMTPPLCFLAFPTWPCRMAYPSRPRHCVQMEVKYKYLLGPTDEKAKALKPNCTECRGCNVELVAMKDKAVRSGWHGGGACTGTCNVPDAAVDCLRLTVSACEGVVVAAEYGGHEGLGGACVQVLLTVCVKL